MQLSRFIPTNRQMAAMLAWCALALPLTSNAALVNLATAPLTSATTTTVLPNLMFVLDNSGSMGQDYTPDYMSTYNVSVASGSTPWTSNSWNAPASDEKNCLDSADDDGSVTTAVDTMDLCVVGDVPYMTSAMNSQYYNPQIRYLPGVNYDGTSKASQSTPTSVLTDAYNKQNKDQKGNSVVSINLTNSYPDRVWCTVNNPTGAQLTDTTVCRKNSNYLYPNATYKYGRTASGSSSDVLGISGAPYYYQVVPSEYCKEADLKDCTLSAAPTGAYTFPAYSRWCSDTALSNCQAVKTSTYIYPRYPGVGTTTAVAATGGGFKLAFGATLSAQSVTSVKVNGVEILGLSQTHTCAGACTSSTTQTKIDAQVVASNALANLVATQINTLVSNPDYTATVTAATRSGSGGSSTLNPATINLTSTLAAGATVNTFSPSVTKSSSVTISGTTAMSGGVTGVTAKPAYTFTRTDIVPTTTSYTKYPNRTDCAGATCTYAEEITNFGNWYAYYRTRLQSMKTAASLAFKSIDNRYRVGFVTINSSSTNYLPIDRFDAGAGKQKDLWFSRLVNTTTTGSTPLRSTLANVGRLFAGKKPWGTADPVQYSCQQNFALLTTDGYWNTDTAASVLNLTGGSIGDMDGGSTPRPMYEGPSASTASLADVAKYYYDTDLRTPALNNCTGALGAAAGSVCDNNVFVSSTDNNTQQHMTTFTLGLGVDGTLLYSSDYKSIKKDNPPTTYPVQTGLGKDYYQLINGYGSPTTNWPVPVADTETAVDDLWHAAVNGQGTYFSAKDPAQLTSGLNTALAEIGAKIGAGAAAATSTLNPVAGDNFAYVASYTTVKWTGNLEARTINIDTGAVSQAASWCVEDVVGGACSAPSSIVDETVGGSTKHYCVTPGASASTCTIGILDGTNCKVELPVSCTGTLASKVNDDSDSRTIFTKSLSGNSLVSFTNSNVDPVHFNAAKLAALSQWSSLTATQQTKAIGANLVNFLRGQYKYEDRSSNNVDDRIYRYREGVLGDAVESQPAFVGKPTFSYVDTGYAAFKASQAGRDKTVFMGTNDGMLHAFNANDGQERWAYVPTPVIPNLWKLADKNYANLHTNYANGSPVISDVFFDGTWHTILVAGLNGGGRGYYALDITTPSSPTLLWEFTIATNPTGTTGFNRGTVTDDDLGYTFGQAVITKLNNGGEGQWVVLVTSGYNNVSPGSGVGYLYILDAKTGTKLSKISTGVGGAVTPSGLGKISVWADDRERQNFGTYAYGGDLLGNLWRFDINAGTVMKLVSFGATKPITARPELGQVYGKRVVFVGTGKYLETSDLTNTDQQTLYAIKDDDATTELTDFSTLTQQTLTSSGSTRTGSNNTFDFRTGRGWYINLPDGVGSTTKGSERQNVDGQLVAGTLLIPTTVPSSTICSPGGYGWFNYFNYANGEPVAGNNIVSSITNAPIVGVNVVYLPSGNPAVSVVTSDNPTPTIVPNVKFDMGSGASNFQRRRMIWRELTPDN